MHVRKSSTQQTRHPVDAPLLISSKAQIVMTSNQTWVAELPIVGIHRVAERGEFRYMMLMTVYDTNDKDRDGMLRMVLQDTKYFGLRDLEGDATLRMAMPLWQVLPGLYQVGFELWDTFGGLSDEEATLSIREVTWRKTPRGFELWEQMHEDSRWDDVITPSNVLTSIFFLRLWLTEWEKQQHLRRSEEATANEKHVRRKGVVETHWPSWAFNHTFLSEMGSMNCLSQTGHDRMDLRMQNSKSQSGEDIHAFSMYFQGCAGGTYLEMGALDGVSFSNTLSFELDLGWRGILIEADPAQFQLLKQNRPANIVINAAVCDTHRVVHFVDSGVPTCRGIREFMDTKFLQLNHHHDWTETEILCMPLSEILELTRVHHIDFFSLV
jgi:hypothetical protein